MQLSYWVDFEKRKNSTKRPTGDGTVIQFQYKQPTSIYNPLIMVSGEDFQTAPPRYAKIGNIYYSVDDVQSYRDGVWLLSMSVDVMATAKDDIGATSAYIVRSTSSYNNMLGDPLVIPEMETEISGASVSTGVFDGNSCYVFQILDGRGSSSAGFLTPYAMIESSLAELAGQLTQADIIGELFQTMNDVTSCIGSCMMVPVSAAKISGTPRTVYCGHFNTGVSSKAVTSPIVTGSASLTIPWKYADFRRNEPFSTVMVYLPFVGNVQLSTNDVNSYDSLSVYTTLDVITGVVAYSIQVGAGGIVIGEYSAKCGSSIPTSTYYSDIGGALNTGISSVLSAGTSIGMGNYAGGAYAALSGAVGTGFSLMNHTASILGSQGSVAQAWQSLPFLRCEVITRGSSDDPSNIGTRCGRPLNAMKIIGQLSGYVQTGGANINAKWPAVMKQKINATMDGGFFYE